MLHAIFNEMQVSGPYTPDAASSGKRALGNGALTLLSRRDGGEQARTQFATADNMTLQLGALSALLLVGAGTEELSSFRQQWQADRLVMDRMDISDLQLDGTVFYEMHRDNWVHLDD